MVARRTFQELLSCNPLGLNQGSYGANGPNELVRDLSGGPTVIGAHLNSEKLVGGARLAKNPMSNTDRNHFRHD